MSISTREEEVVTIAASSNTWQEGRKIDAVIFQFVYRCSRGVSNAASLKQSGVNKIACIETLDQ